MTCSVLPPFFGGSHPIETTDYEFKELSTRFTSCEKTTTVFLAEICKYRDSVTGKIFGL